MPRSSSPRRRHFMHHCMSKLMAISIMPNSGCGCLFFGGLLPLQAYFGGFSTVIRRGGLLKPGMTKGLVCFDAFTGVIHENLLQQIQEVPTELIIVWDDFL